MNETDLNEIFDKCHLKIANGKMPSPNKYEVIVHENVLKNKKLKIGDTLSLSSGDYKISGSFSGGCMISLGIKNRTIEQYKKLGAKTSSIHYGGIVFPKNSTKSMNNFIDNLVKNNKKITAVTMSLEMKDFKNQTKNINLIMSIIVVVVILSISASLSVVISSLYSNRIDEFGILNAIGYSKTKIIFQNIVFEIAMMVIVSWFLGIAISFGVLYIINYKVFKPIGQSINLFDIQSIKYTILSLIIILIISIIPVAMKLFKTDLISVIERR